ncbi:MAG: hypothetical protein JWL62_1882 [Hyphomicrobiales bacterium]|nr:hypothetical protein [Hyphomicrobiales bacterium]
MFKSLFAGVLLSVFAGTAMAADLPYRGNAPSPAPYYAAPVFSWTGVYAGINGGWGFGKLTKTGTQISNISGGMIGGTLGYNYQVQQFVFGIEGDLDWAKIDGGKTWVSGVDGVTGHARISSLATVRGRLGYSVDRALLYVTGGYAGGSVKVNVSHPATPFTGSATNWENGFVVGAGLEYAFTNNISAKAEYLYSSLGAKSYFTQDVLSSGAHVQQVRTGVNYRF